MLTENKLRRLSKNAKILAQRDGTMQAAALEIIVNDLIASHRQQSAMLKKMGKAIKYFIAEKTIKGTIDSAIERDMAFADEVPSYGKDCDSILNAYQKVQETLAEYEEGGK